MKNQEQTLDERRADCRIWAHLIFWWIIPFGWTISVCRMRYEIPAYVVLGATCLAVVASPYSEGLSAEENFDEGWANGRKYGLVGGVIGSALTVKEILESRRKTKDQKE